MKIALTLAAVLFLAGCQSEKTQDWRISCLESSYTAQKGDLDKVQLTLNQMIQTGTLTVTTGTLVATVPNLPPAPKPSTGVETIAKVIDQAAKATPLLPAPFGLIATGILAALSGLFKRKS